MLKLRLAGEAGRAPVTELMRKFSIPSDLMRGSGTALFDFISEAIADVCPTSHAHFPTH